MKFECTHILRKSSYSQTPVNVEMNGHKNFVIAEYVDLSGPTFQSCVSSLHQFWIKECIESINFGNSIFSPSTHKKIHIEVYDLKKLRRTVHPE